LGWFRCCWSCGVCEKKKIIKSNNKKEKKKEEKIENFIKKTNKQKFKFKIKKQQQPFYRILELALLYKEKYYEKTNIKSNIHTNKPALHNEPMIKNRALQRVHK
jgi:hypothetical protein